MAPVFTSSWHRTSKRIFIASLIFTNTTRYQAIDCTLRTAQIHRYGMSKASALQMPEKKIIRVSSFSKKHNKGTSRQQTRNITWQQFYGFTSSDQLKLVRTFLQTFSPKTCIWNTIHNSVRTHCFFLRAANCILCSVSTRRIKSSRCCRWSSLIDWRTWSNSRCVHVSILSTARCLSISYSSFIW